MPAPIPGQHLPLLPPSVNIARRGRHLHDMLNRLTRSSGPQGVFASPAGSCDMPIDTSQGFLAIADGSIPARSSSIAGVGKVFAVTSTATYAGDGSLSGVDLTTPSTQDFDVYNPSSTTMSSGNGINSGQYCWCMYDASGLLIVVPLECA